MNLHFLNNLIYKNPLLSDLKELSTVLGFITILFSQRKKHTNMAKMGEGADSFKKYRCRLLKTSKSLEQSFGNTNRGFSIYFFKYIKNLFLKNDGRKHTNNIYI